MDHKYDDTLKEAEARALVVRGAAQAAGTALDSAYKTYRNLASSIVAERVSRDASLYTNDPESVAYKMAKKAYEDYGKAVSASIAADAAFLDALVVSLEEQKKFLQFRADYAMAIFKKEGTYLC